MRHIKALLTDKNARNMDKYKDKMRAKLHRHITTDELINQAVESFLNNKGK